jgi:hypothetical protein
MKTFVLPCTSSDPDYDAGCDVAIVKLDETSMQHIRQRRVLVKEAHRKDNQVWEIYFWDEGSVHFCALTMDPFDDEAGTDVLEEGQGYLVTETRPAPRTKGEPHKVECIQMVVDTEGCVRWTCIPKSSHIYITTENLPL